MVSHRTLIDLFQEYTHTSKFEEDVPNQDFREIIKMLADMCQRMKNVASGEASRGIYFFDIPELKDNLHWVNTFFDNLRRLE